MKVVKYHNDLNTVAFRKFNKNELDLFFSICSVVKEKGLDTIRFNFEELKDIVNYKSRSLERFVTDLDNTYKKMLNLTFTIEENILDIERFVLFTNFVIKGSQQYVDVTVNQKFKYVLNDLTNNFTRFELNEFIELKSGYSKAMYRLLKQFRNTGFYKITIEEFKRLLDIPESFRMSHIDSKVLNPIKKELSNCFNKLKITKVKAKKGNKIEYLEFKFEKEMPYVKGDKVFFMDKNNEYYSKSIYHLTAEELDHKFPADEVDPNQTVIDDFL